MRQASHSMSSKKWYILLTSLPQISSNLRLQIPNMNPYPEPLSVLIMDNCRIHKSEMIRLALEERGCRLLFLPAYSPDLHPIEHSFSACEFLLCLLFTHTHYVCAVKAWIRANYTFFENHPHPEYALQLACLAAIDSNKCRGWFRNCGYRLSGDE